MLRGATKNVCCGYHFRFGFNILNVASIFWIVIFSIILLITLTQRKCKNELKLENFISSQNFTCCMFVFSLWHLHNKFRAVTIEFKLTSVSVKRYIALLLYFCYFVFRISFVEVTNQMMPGFLITRNFSITLSTLLSWKPLFTRETFV